MRPAPSRQSAAASLWICQCRPSVVARVLLQPVHADVAPARAAGRVVITEGSVMNGPPSSGQQVMIGSRRGRARSSTTSWHGAARDGLRLRVGEALELAEARASLSASPCGGVQLEHVRDASPRPRRAVDAEREAHAPLGAELVDQQRDARAAHVAEQQRRPAGLHRAVGDLGDLEVRVDLGVDLGELAARAQQLDPLAQVVADHRGRSTWVTCPVCVRDAAPCRRGARVRRGEQLRKRRMRAR